MAQRQAFAFNDIHKFTAELFGRDLHAKRVYSLANATLGIMTGASLAVHMIGQSLAQARGRLTKHAIKQVDRLLSNPGIDVWVAFARWVPHAVGNRRSIMVALDWTEFDADGHSTLVLTLLTRHGRSTPLIWLTVEKSQLKGRRNQYEDELLQRFHDVLPEGVAVTLMADRGFGDQKLFEFVEHRLGFDYVIRFRGNIRVTSAKGETRESKDWVGKGGRARTLRGALVTVDRQPVNTVVCVQAKDMKEPWCLAASDRTASAKTLIGYYAKRWSIETTFRDTKDLRFGMGMAKLRISSCERRDRLFLINAFAIMLLTLLGAACEATGYDRYLRANTSRKRTHSLFRQGCMVYDLIPNMPDQYLIPIMQQFADMIREQQSYQETLWVV